jgi:signal transduction histidine kinase
MSNVPLYHAPAAKPEASGAVAIQELRRSREEMDHFVRALSHDMSANFMLLSHSFGRLKSTMSAEAMPEVKELVQHVDACLEESRRFLDDLVGLARTGQVDMEPRAAGLAEVVDEVLFEQRALIEKRRVRVEVHTPLPTFWCNRHRLKQVVTNLVRNALKHGCDPADARIVVDAARPTAEEESRAMAAFGIYDNGPGIDPRYHEEIFLPGRRLAGAHTDGSGMGLAIVRKVVEHYGGAVRLDRSCPRGTRFLVILPTPPDSTLNRPQPPVKEGTPAVPGRCLECDPPHAAQVAPPHSLPVGV